MPGIAPPPGELLLAGPKLILVGIVALVTRAGGALTRLRVRVPCMPSTAS